jgi:hypothetical protein
MSFLTQAIDRAAAIFCTHEWSSRHEANRWYLECVNCRATTAGIEVGRGASGLAAARAEPIRRPLLAFARARSRPA